MQLLTRPYEFFLLLASVLLFFLPSVRQRDVLRALARALPAVALAALPAILLMLVHNKQVTGSWTTLPYELSRYQYGVPATFTVQPNPVPHRPLTADQQRDYEVQVAAHGKDTDTVGRYLERLVYRARFYRFFLLAPLYLALAAFFAALREWRFVWVAVALLIFSLGANFYPYFYPHYIAAATCLFVLMSVTGLERLSRLRIRGWPAGEEAARLVIFLCIAHFVFWYGAHLVDNPSLIQYESSDFINHGDPQGRTAVQSQLAQSPGKQLVFVRYWPQHRFEQWVHNAAQIDAAPVVWARDLGTAENERLRRYYPDRTAWLLEPDAKPPRLQRYEEAP
jgi:hypothetical protein